MLKNLIVLGLVGLAFAGCGDEAKALGKSRSPQKTLPPETVNRGPVATTTPKAPVDEPSATPVTPITPMGGMVVHPVPIPTPGFDSIDFVSFVSSLHVVAEFPRETHRVRLHNVKNGLIEGSRDGGRTWSTLGHVTSPITGEYWRPTVDAGVFAFNFLRGPSSVFASAVNSIHLRFSDPVGYKLPKDLNQALVEPRGLSIAPKEIAADNHGDAPGRAAMTDISGGVSLFGEEWAPKVGSAVLMGDGMRFAPIPYNFGPTNDIRERSYLMLITVADEAPIQYLEFENKAGGVAKVKREGQAPVAVARVLQAVQGVGRFKGSELLPKPGALRAAHAGVIDIGTTDYRVGAPKPPGTSIVNLRGGFQIVPSHHYCDQSMKCGGDHGEVYMVVGPLQTPPNLDRYDMGVEGTAPLFQQGVRSGSGTTWMLFKGDDAWYELNDAITLGKFRTKDGTVIRHLRGVLPDVLRNVKSIRFVVEVPQAPRS